MTASWVPVSEDPDNGECLKVDGFCILRTNPFAISDLQKQMILDLFNKDQEKKQ